MKRTLLIIAATIAFHAHAAWALDIRAVTDKPTADDPQYENEEAWPMLLGDEYFPKQKWEKGRVLILNLEMLLEEGKGNRAQKLLCSDPSTWINASTGKAAVSMPDMETDIILPDSEVPYIAMVKAIKLFECRHLTVGRNATIEPIQGRGGVRIFGNVWVRPTGRIKGGMWGMGFVGDKHTFIRNDWPEDGVLEKVHDERAISPYKVDGEIIKTPWLANSITTYMGHDKPEGISTEVLGLVSIADEVGIRSGTFIIGRDSRLITTGPSCINVANGAKVVLMDGALCSHGQNQFVNRDWGVRAGAQVTGGTPDRPLKRDAYMGLGYRNWQNLPVPPYPEAKKRKEANALPDGTILHYGYGSYSVIVEGDLIAYPADGSDARLVVCWQRIASGGAGAWGRHDEPFNKVFAKIPPKIGIWIGPDSMVENVRFDDLRFGGIVTESMETFKKWKNVSFGDACLSKDPQDLVRGYKAELAGREKAHPMSILPPKKPYVTMPNDESR